MTIPFRTTFLALALISGCAAQPAALVAYAGPASDVAPSRPPRTLAVKMEPIREGTLHDPAQMMELRSSIERQISAQVRDLSDERYRAVARPRLAEALRAAGLEQADVDFILHGVDYHRSL